MKLALPLLLAIPWFASAGAEMQVKIDAGFPGGNVLVHKNEGNLVQIAPDLRGGPAWFYWCFEAEASQAGQVTFAFAGPRLIGVRGPAVSQDGGKSWQWMGVERVEYAPPAVAGARSALRDAFRFDFTEANQRVRFAVAIPYLQRDLDAFLEKHAGNRHLTQGTLAQTRKGRPVELLKIGKPGRDKGAVLFTARHHACESMASYVLEGLLQEAMSESPAGVEFRNRYVLYAVPMVDKDGVQDGDQGKNRPPHDHNRDYGESPIYPEVKAIQELAESRKVRFSLDLHCPALRGDIHEAFHFLGLAIPHNKENVSELIAWLREERPPAVMAPLNLLKDSAQADRRINSHYFGLREHAVFAATLEIPYTQPKVPLDADMARQYGASLLKAWVRTKFVTPSSGARESASHDSLLALRESFQRLYKSKPQEAERMAKAYLDGEALPPLFRIEANSLMAMLRLQQRRYDDALRFNEVVMADANATTSQRATALLRRTQIAAGDPKASPDALESSVAEALRLSYPSLEYQAAVFGSASQYYEVKQDYERALGYTRRQLPVAASFEKGRTLNRIALLHDLLHQNDAAEAARREAVRILREQLGPVPARNVFAAMMTGDLFDALCGIPTATLEEKREAAALVLNHEITSAALKERVRQALAKLEQSN